MAKHNSKKIRRTNPSGSHQINWLWGQESVLETLRAERWRVYELFLTAEVSHQHRELLKAKQKIKRKPNQKTSENTSETVDEKHSIEIEIVSAAKLEELAKTTEHEGIVARVSKYPYESLEILESVRTTEPMALATGFVSSTVSDITPEAIAYGSGKTPFSLPHPLVVVIDRVQDAFTFASILRCCEAARVSAVIVGQFCQAQVTTQVARASSGAVNHFPIIQADDLASATQQLKDLGFQLIAIDPQSQFDVCDKPLALPLAVVLASDTLGLDPKILEICDHRVRIPTLGKTNPLLSAVAAGILLYETRRQQRGVI
ncbi:MAG: RNA methyltransferase [Planctomycetota bacterium]|nr:RNA methyltransferase [Planctomycetota bacterium]